ncbi:MAG: transketolase, partial [Muribaculaceae bacterium]|nr:transketolase [Muribaculaceae bacterium]
LALANRERPTVLIFSRQDVADLPGEERRQKAALAERGGYVVFGDESRPDIVLIGNGSDVSLLIDAAVKLADSDIKARVVSVPSIGLFMDQDARYRESVIPAGVPEFGLTSGLPSVLYPVMKGEFEIYGLERFGASAPAKVLEEKFGYTAENIYNRILEWYKNR